ncbi:hypothetical protein [Flavobacterium cellulosilyticum]|uniref:Gliding motility lipoprotein GldH n=1 Tax=Flavobacterium cellulosilyticum TaxID=2541731 RepID=A0A4R5C6F3_9FLAO|nr:hypothetical protein [Flavobacterium cellulosilyticum]TDD95268.1 hypothetical protein E0F76_14595 [Flavobacterium cellulosilyticum]
MKKIITLLAVVGMFTFQSCTTTTDSNYVDNDTISTVFENKIPFNFTSTNGYKVKFIFPNTIISSDMVLVYRLSGSSNGNDLWEFLPETHYFADGTRNFSFNFDFTQNDVQIYLEGNNLQTVGGEFRLNQTFRFVVVPANLIYGVDKNNYVSVMAAINSNENKVQTINF